MPTPQDAIWYGLFLCDNFDSMLERRIENQHVTFGFRVPVPADVPWGQWFAVGIVGYANDGYNEAYAVMLPREVEQWYYGADQPHITLSVAGNSSPVRSGELDFTSLDTVFEVPMRFGYFCDGAVHFE